ncbi:MAG: S8 family serine peptidase, partial [Bacilli bacterium]|nr:S8 family serine peptidase [Bacilli bacterium]
MKKLKIIGIILLLVVVFGGTTTFVLLKTNQPKKKVIDINEDIYEAKIDAKKNEAVVDGEKVKLNELLGVSEKELEKKVENNTFEEFLKENLVGDINVVEDNIQINNPYAIKKLIVEADSKEEIEKDENVKEIKEIAENLYTVTYETAKDTKDGLKELEQNENIKSAGTDGKVHMTATTVTTSTATEAQYIGWGVKATGLDSYINYINGKSSAGLVRVAVLDTGVNAFHEIFKMSTTADKFDFTRAFDYVNLDRDPDDDAGHGTEVAGVIAEATSKNVKIVPVKVLDSNGDGDLSDIIQAVDILKDEVDVINLSLGMSESILNSNSRVIAENKFLEAYNKGCIVVCATGNEAEPVSYPASSSYTIAVGSVDSNNAISYFSNYGSQVDFVMPGEDLILPAYETTDRYYTGQSGTSFSSPYMAAAVAQIRSEFPNYTFANVMTLLKANAKDLGTSGKDNYYGYGVIDFNKSKFLSPVISSYSKTGIVGSSETITVNATSGPNITQYAVTSSSTTPSSWTNVSKAGKTVTLKVKVTTNGTYYIWLKNASNKTVSQSVSVSTIDTVAPSIVSNLASNSIASSSANLTITAKDTVSGISKVIFYYKKNGASQYSSTTKTFSNVKTQQTITTALTGLSSETKYYAYAEIYDACNNKATSTTINFTTLEAPLSVKYQTHVQDIGWQGYVTNGTVSGTSHQSKRLEAIKIELYNKGQKNGGIKYKTHVEQYGWMNYVSDGAQSGTDHESKRLEAIAIELTGDIANNYDIYYRVHAQNVGWLDWTKNGEYAGTAGYGYRLEAIQIVIQLKTASAPGSTINPYEAIKVRYSTHIQDLGWQNNINEGQISGTSHQSRRLEAITIVLKNLKETGSIEYATHVQDIGWQNFVSNGGLSGTHHQSKRLEAIKIRLTGEVATKFDVYYRVHAQEFGWLDWACNGQEAGTAHFSYRLEAIQIKLVRKNDTASRPTNTQRPFV